jgi:hypothetical protein
MATRRLRDYLPAILVEESSKNPLIDGFLQIIESFLIGDTANKIHEIHDPHPATLVRAQVEVSPGDNQGLKLTVKSADTPNPFRAGDAVQATTGRTQPSRIHYTTIEGSVHVLILQDVLSVADNRSIRLADVTESTRCFRVAPGHQISRGNRISVSQNKDEGTIEASGIVVAVDGDFIYLARGLSETFSLDDNASPVFVRRVYEPIEKMIDDLVNLFDPWKTRPDLLPWLASVVGLDISPQWNEYQKRLLLSQIAGLHHRLGTKEAMLKLIDIYVPESRKGRICIDDCESLYRLKITDDNHGQLDLLAQSIHYSSEAKQPKVSLLHPTAIVADGTGHYYVADIGGAESGTSNDNPAAIWKITESGAIVGEPITNIIISKPIGLATDNSNHLLALNDSQGGNFSVIRIAQNAPETIFSHTNFFPCGLCYSSNAISELIFIAGREDISNKAQIISLTKSQGNQYTLHNVYDLNEVDSPIIKQPISFLRISENAFLIGDGKFNENAPANIFYVEIDLSCSEIKRGPIPLLKKQEQITFPNCIINTGVARQFILIDTGLRNPQAGKGFGPVVTTPIIYLIITDDPQSPTEATLEKISTNRILSNPFAMQQTHSNEYILIDKGFFNTKPRLNKDEFRSFVHIRSIVNHFKEEANIILPIRKSIERTGINLKPSHVDIHINFAEQ